MDRLTERDEYGNADIIGVDSEDLQLNLEFDSMNRVTAALNRLAEYEETGLTPEQVKKLYDAVRMIKFNAHAISLFIDGVEGKR